MAMDTFELIRQNGMDWWCRNVLGICGTCGGKDFRHTIEECPRDPAVQAAWHAANPGAEEWLNAAGMTAFFNDDCVGQ